MKRKDKKAKDLSLDTLIGANTVFEGSIQSDRSVCIEGSIRGRNKKDTVKMYTSILLPER
jgi:cytoskeletal protein CcmA (bactofilin family)